MSDKPLDVEYLKKIIVSTLCGVGYKDVADMVRDDNDSPSEIEDSPAVAIGLPDRSPYLFIYQMQYQDTGKIVWLLEGYKTIHNYPHSPDDQSEFTITASASPHAIAEALARYEFETRLNRAMESTIEWDAMQ